MTPPLPLARGAGLVISTSPASTRTITDARWAHAIAREKLARAVIEKTPQCTETAALRAVLLEVDAGLHAHALSVLGFRPSEASLRRWVRALAEGGVEALMPRRDGRKRKDYGWELRAQQLYARPQRPLMSTVAYWLREEGWTSATNSRVRRYLKSLPSHLSETAPARVGRHYYAQNIKPHVVRDSTVLAVGECYEGDGHTCDVYVQHPATGTPFRPELTVWIDIRSQRVTGWWLGETENAIDVLYALSSAIREHDHVPALLHTDPGSGYVNKMMADEALGFYARLSIHPIKTLPGNARGKGLTEGWFRWFEERLGKRFASYCGHCRTDDQLSRMRAKLRRGEIELPSFLQYRDAVASYVAAYNAETKDELGGKSPDEIWRDLERNPLHLPPEVLYRPRREATVRGWEVRCFNRRYRAAELAAYERRTVVVEYDIHDDQRVWIRDAKGRLVCEAMLVERRPWIGVSVLADRRARAAEGQRRRLRERIEEVDARARRPITAAAMVRAIEAMSSSHPDGATAPAPDLSQRHALVIPARQRRAARPEPVSDEARRLAAELARVDEEQETAEQRFSRALALERATDLSEADARWLEIYKTSAEYAARMMIYEESAGASAPAPE